MPDAPAPTPDADGERAIHRQRYELLRHINAATDKPLIALSFVWLGLLILDLTYGLSRPLEIVHYVIWGLFIADFLVEFIIAPRKRTYLRRNVLTAVALALPAVRVLQAFRLFRFLRLARAARLARTVRVTRSVRLVRVLTSINRGLRAAGNWLGRRGAGYVAATTILVTFAGAAGMWAFENPTALTEAGHDTAGDPRAGINGYGEAVWWTAMLMTTMGSEYWPRTFEGRMLCFLLSMYAFAVFGYITATIASYFVGQEEQARQKSAPLPAAADLAALRAEIAALSARLAGQADSSETSPRPKA